MAESPSELVAIARAAHEVGDKALKRNAIQKLFEEFGIRISFPRKRAAIGATEANKELVNA